MKENNIGMIIGNILLLTILGFLIAGVVVYKNDLNMCWREVKKDYIEDTEKPKYRTEKTICPINL